MQFFVDNGLTGRRGPSGRTTVRHVQPADPVTPSCYASGWNCPLCTFTLPSGTKGPARERRRHLNEHGAEGKRIVRATLRTTQGDSTERRGRAIQQLRLDKLAFVDAFNLTRPTAAHCVVSEPPQPKNGTTNGLSWTYSCTECGRSGRKILLRSVCPASGLKLRGSTRSSVLAHLEEVVRQSKETAAARQRLARKRQYVATYLS